MDHGLYLLFYFWKGFRGNGKGINVYLLNAFIGTCSSLLVHYVTDTALAALDNHKLCFEWFSLTCETKCNMCDTQKRQ